LETREVWNLNLENADLVTLSACQTQLGELSAGDELVGLSRAFIYAGTSSLVASLWSVEDESTAYLMEHFYGYLKEGMGKAEALRQAKLDTMEKYPSPHHWAAFTLIGDMGEVRPERGIKPDLFALTKNRWFWLGGAFLLALFSIGLWVRNHRE
jgi:CHAT domain-containing protein